VGANPNPRARQNQVWDDDTSFDEDDMLGEFDFTAALLNMEDPKKPSQTHRRRLLADRPADYAVSFYAQQFE
jgi:hypothetical protein